MRRTLAVAIAALLPTGLFAASGPDVIQKAIHAWRSRRVPYYLAEQAITRYIGTRGSQEWKRVDEITEDLRYDNRNLWYYNIRVNGVPTRHPSGDHTVWTASRIHDILDDILASSDALQSRGTATIAGRTALVSDFSVDRETSHWMALLPDDEQRKTSYNGTIWIDQETFQLLRLEQVSTSMPADSPISGLRDVNEFRDFDFGGEQVLFHAIAEDSGCLATTGTCERTVVTFRNYRPYTPPPLPSPPPPVP